MSNPRFSLQKWGNRKIKICSKKMLSTKLWKFLKASSQLPAWGTCKLRMLATYTRMKPKKTSIRMGMRMKPSSKMKRTKSLLCTSFDLVFTVWALNHQPKVSTLLRRKIRAKMRIRRSQCSNLVTTLERLASSMSARELLLCNLKTTGSWHSWRGTICLNFRRFSMASSFSLRMIFWIIRTRIRCLSRPLCHRSITFRS